jgi:hypothetical protein
MHSGASNRSEPTLMTRPSGSCGLGRGKEERACQLDRAIEKLESKAREEANSVVLDQNGSILREPLVLLQVVTRSSKSSTC